MHKIRPNEVLQKTRYLRLNLSEDILEAKYCSLFKEG